ncbi:MAG: hypothetical protein E7B11_16335 [Clostridiales bacterium]|nr:hypothetical protein [Clostridiales bacterium]MDU3242135.1 hypothetical protein [Clostridiales bacterium]
MMAKEKQYLRELAKRQAAYANLPEMEQKKKKWMDVNTGKKTIPPVVVETETFCQDMVPDYMLYCTDPMAREMEYRFLKYIREFELIQDDKVIPDVFEIPIHTEIDEFGFPVEECHALDANGRDVGYEYHSPIRNLEEDFHRLKAAVIKVDNDKTRRSYEFAQDILDGIMPVSLTGTPPMIALPFQAVKLLGLENYMMSMYDCPETLHKLMHYLTENQLKVMKYYEDNAILTLNNGNQETCLSSYGFTDRLPATGAESPALKDIWIWAEAEEAASISPEMFREFCLPYMAKTCREMGLIYYGCCEPMHDIWQDVIREIPNIQKVSVSPWSNQQKMGEMLKGTDVVFSRKPYANYLGVESRLDEEAWAKHIKETLHAAKGCQCEFIMRDVYRVRDLQDVRRAVDIVRRLGEEN